MTLHDFVALAPFSLLTLGVMIQLLAISFWRSQNVALFTALAALIAALFGLTVDGGLGSSVLQDVLVLDGITRFFNSLFLIAAILTALFSHLYLQGRAGEQEEFFVLLLLATLGAMTMAAANHFTTLLLGLEILSISLYVMIGYPEEHQAPLEAALKYLVLSGVASTILLFGMALVYMQTGTLSFAQIGEHGNVGNLMLIGQSMMLAAIAFKLSLVPFHMWTPDVYQGAPAPVTGYLATVSKAAMLVVLLRYGLATDLLSNDNAFMLVTLFGILSMLAGNVLALMQENLKRMLAYSSIAHLGYLMIAVAALRLAADQETALETTLVYLSAYFAMSLAAFGVISMLSDAAGDGDTEAIDAYQGLFWRRPAVAAVLTVSMLALAGIPLTLGFVAKFYLITTGVQGMLWALVWALVVGSAVSIYYYLRVVLVMTRQASDVPDNTRQPAIFEYSLLTVLGAIVVFFGVQPTPLISLVRAALAL